MREKAAIFRMTESEKERARLAKIKDDRKRILMQQIQEDMEQRRQRREDQELAIKQERERARQEQAEYEKL